MGIIQLGHGGPTMTTDRHKASFVFRFDAVCTEHCVGPLGAVEAHPCRCTSATCPFVLTFWASIRDDITEFYNLNDSMVGWDQYRVRSYQLMEVVTEGTLHTTSLAPLGTH